MKDEKSMVPVEIETGKITETQFQEIESILHQYPERPLNISLHVETLNQADNSTVTGNIYHQTNTGSSGIGNQGGNIDAVVNNNGLASDPVKK